MKNSFECGNLGDKAKSHRSWVIGHFIEKESLLHSDDVEVRYHHAKKGETNESKTQSSSAHSITILLHGKFKIVFPESGSEYVLEKEGDYIFWNPLVKHYWEVLEDSLLITVRWPSINML